MSKRGALLPLRGGGVLAYDEYGAADGTPVIFCHGWPSSRTMAELTDAPARELGVRIISPDRPGIRDSSFASGRTLLDWPEVLGQLADALELPRFRMLGISGGAPYTYVTGWALPERVIAIAAVSGAPPIAELGDESGLLQLHRAMLRLHRARPAWLRLLFRAARPFAARKVPLRLRPMLLKFLQPCDADVLRDARSFEACFESSREAWQTVDGLMADAEIYARPWGFQLEDVQVPVSVWHGTSDRTFATALAQEVARRLPKGRLQVVPKAGHYSLPIRHMREILADLVATGSA